MKFTELNLHEDVLGGIKAAGFESCMPVQQSVLPVSLTGCDVMVQSKTGSGKTAAFVLTFLEQYVQRRDEGFASKCLIVAPTRELAQQISDDAKLLSSGIYDFRIACIYGGVGYDRQEKLLRNDADLIVGTPGRIIDFIRSGILPAKDIDTFVIDEADRLFDMGFLPDIKRIFSSLCEKEYRQTMLFSATLEQRVRELAWEFMNEPEVIVLEGDSVTVDKISQSLYHVAKAEKFKLLLQILRAEDPQSAIIFTNLRHMTEELSVRLRLNGYNAGFISGDLPQGARQKALDDMKAGKIRLLVATDVAARGLQIDDLPLVVNYDIPEDYENYVHRIGRTARAGKSGKAITLADEEFVYGLEAIEKYIKMKIPVMWADFDDIEDLSLGKKWTEKKTSTKPSKSPKKKTQTQKKPSQTAPKKAPEKKKVHSPKEVKPSKPLSQMSEKERMDFYRQKYGFEPVKVEKPAVEVKAPEKKRSFFQRILGLLGLGEKK